MDEGRKEQQVSTETITRGRRHEYEPEVDSLSYIDFESDDQGYETARASGEPKDLENWLVEAARAFLSEVGWDKAAPEIEGVLHEEHQCREDGFWSWVTDQALDAGFDVYDSDSRTELFPGGTLCDANSDCCGVALALTAAHESGEHIDTARGDCPLCQEIHVT